MNTGPGDDPTLGEAELLDRLHEEWQRRDPVPQDLAERCLLTMGLADLDLELLLLQEEVLSLEGARSGEGTRTLTFTSEGLSLTLTITAWRRGRYRVDGWVAPLGGGRVTAHHASAADVEGDVDREGRFVLLDVPSGLVQIVYHPDDAPPARALDDAQPAPASADERRSPRAVAAPPVRL